MNKKNYWASVLLAEIFFLVFLTSLFPESWQSFLFPFLYSALYLTSVGGLERNRSTMYWVAGSLLVAQGAFKLFNMPIIEAVSKILNFAFFSFIVFSLIHQISSAREVTKRVILEAVNGYLLLGLVFTFLIGLMIQFDPMSFNFSTVEDGNLHNSMYFGFVTFATLGYGDLVPIKPYAKSLSILIAVCGQLYVAIIIALLVGKFSSQSKELS